MSEPYIGQVSCFAFPFSPLSWAFCDGGTVPLNQFSALFALIGMTFGGDGSTKIGLPNLGGTAPCGTGQGPGLTNRYLGQGFGSQTVLLDQTTIPAHAHNANAVSADRGATLSNVPTALSGITVSEAVNLYTDGGSTGIMAANAVSPSGGNAAHNNQQPYIGMNYCMALLGQFPYFD